jgi:hypothetical protein
MLGWDQYRDLVSTYWEDVLGKYASAWNVTQSVVSQVGQPADRPTGALARSRRNGPSAATSWVPAPGAGGSVTVSDLRSIVRDTTATIDASRVEPGFHATGDDRVLELAADTTGLPRGVYVGTAEIKARANVTTVPTYIFVSGAVPA